MGLLIRYWYNRIINFLEGGNCVKQHLANCYLLSVTVSIKLSRILSELPILEFTLALIERRKLNTGGDYHEKNLFTKVFTVDLPIK